VKIEVKRNFGEVTLTITISTQKVTETFTKIKKEALREVSAPGFRKGKVPTRIGEKQLSEDSLAEVLFNKLIPPAYTAAIEKEDIKPIIPPQLKILSYRKDTDLVFEAKTAERPKINLKDYKTSLKKLKGKLIYEPEGKPLKGGEKVTAGQVLEKLRETAELTIPPILIEQEVQRMLSSLIDQTQKLGITVEQYLLSQGKTAEQLKKEYQEIAERNLKDEFIVSEITIREKVEITPQEVEEAIAAAPDEKTKETFHQEAGRHYIEDILRKRKTLEFLIKISEEK